jgi:antitoxin VapB
LIDIKEARVTAPGYKGRRPGSPKGRVRKAYDGKVRKPAKIRAAKRMGAELELKPATLKRWTRSSQRDTARLFMHGRSQAVRLPLAFRMPGDRVRIRRVKEGVLLEPIATDWNAVFDEMDRRRGGAQFMPEGREQPEMPEDEDLFD